MKALINTINHLVAKFEDCFAQRTAVRAALAKDEVWQSSYFSKATQMMDAQDNASGSLIPWKPLQDQPLKEGGEVCKELLTFR